MVDLIWQLTHLSNGLAPLLASTLSVLSETAADTAAPSTLNQFISEYGPFAMIVLLMASGIGIPIGEEVINIPAGIFVGRGELNPVSAYLAAYFGVTAGDFAWFFVCRRLGKQLLHRKWFKRLAHPRRLLQVKHQFDRRGPWVLVFARFIPGARTPTITIAGVLHMPWRTFSFIELSLCAVATAIQVTIGVLIGRQLANESLQTTVLTTLAVVAAILAISASTTWILNARQEGGPTPRERIQWLRRLKSTRVRSRRQ